MNLFMMWSNSCFKDMQTSPMTMCKAVISRVFYNLPCHHQAKSLVMSRVDFSISKFYSQPCHQASSCMKSKVVCITNVNYSNHFHQASPVMVSLKAMYKVGIKLPQP